jgi:hypothetical protein
LQPSIASVASLQLEEATEAENPLASGARRHPSIYLKLGSDLFTCGVTGVAADQIMIGLCNTKLESGVKRNASTGGDE